MKRVGIFYSTREGQTRRIAEYVAARLRIRGLEADVTNVAEGTEKHPGRYAAVVLAASVHAGKHEAEMRRFVKQHLAELNALPSAFLSVTLSEAGAERPSANPDERARSVADVHKMLDEFSRDTGWRPKHVKPVAGALLYTKYDFLVRFIMKRIARKAGGDTDTSRDYEYTDWAALNRFADELSEEILQPDAARHVS